MTHTITIVCGEDNILPDPVSTKLDSILEILKTMATFAELKDSLDALGVGISEEAKQVAVAIEESVKKAVADAVAPLQAKIDELLLLPTTEVPQEIIDEIKALADKVSGIVEPGSPSVVEVPAPVEVPPVVAEAPVVEPAPAEVPVVAEGGGEVTNSPNPEILP